MTRYCHRLRLLERAGRRPPRLYQQELDAFPHAGSAGRRRDLTGTPTYQVGDHVVLPAPDQEISGAIGHIGEQEIRIDTGPYAWSQQMVSRGQFEEWLRQDERNAGLFQPEVRETAEPAVHHADHRCLSRG